MTALLARLRARTPAMVAALGALVTAESPSTDRDAVAACADVAAGIGAALLGAPPGRLGGGHLRWRWPGTPRVLLLGHLDTVWPRGTTARWPFRVDGDRATGPGCFDMKAGIVQGLEAVAALDDPAGVTVLLTADEELGSPGSRGLVEEAAEGAAAALVLEPSGPGGALKTARKGVALYEVTVTGRAAHAGLEPERGANALVELAHQLLALKGLGGAGGGTTVIPTLAAAGTASNVVPATARCTVDVRVPDAAEQARVDTAMAALRPVSAGTAVRVTGGANRPPLERAASAGLYRTAVAVAAGLGLPPLAEVAVGGGSDGNFTAGRGVPTLDGLGAVGSGAHAEGEHVLVPAMPERAALVAGLIAALRTPAPG